MTPLLSHRFLISQKNIHTIFRFDILCHFMLFLFLQIHVIHPN